jgi:GTPase SAR1 family protein
MNHLSHIVLDRPISDSKEDLLNYNKLYADEMCSLITNTPYKSIKIALIAGYGSGKTSTLNFLKQRIKDENETKFVHIKSIWDYSPNDILKKILRKVDKEAGLNLKFKETLNKEQIEIPKKILWIRLILFLIIAIVLILSIFFMSNFGSINTLFSGFIIPEILVKLIIELIVIGLLLFFGIDTLIRQNKKPPASSYDFEEYWKNIITEAKKKDIEKLILAIDDLDRCKPEIVNGIFGKLNTIAEMTEEKEEKLQLAIIVPFSLNNYLSIGYSRETQLLKQNYKKFFDVLLHMSELSKLELTKIYNNKKISKNEERNDKS